MPSQDQHVKAALKLLRKCGQRHDRYRVFSDCMELIAISISNSVDLAARARREARYLEIVARYDRETVETFPRVLAEVVMALETGPDDVLGRIFTELEIHNSDRGQFFTPYPVCRMMGMLSLGDPAAMRSLIEEKGYVTAMEPACGSGAMVIALAEAMREVDINYQRYLHVTATDIDRRAVHMAYIQFSLLHIPAEVIVGNSLSMEAHDRWFTPAHILGGWNARRADYRRRYEHSGGPEAVSANPPPAVAPAPGRAMQPPGPPVQLSLF